TQSELSTNELNVFRRFSSVLSLTYRRFNDLKKAEAQAREAQIETALEKVRSRTMAMQQSDELTDASFILDSQVRALGIKTRGCAFNIYGENDSAEWFSSEMGTMPMYKTPRENIFLRYYEEGQKGKAMYIESFTGDACAAHYDYLCTLPIVGEALKEFKESGGSFPTQQIDHVTYFKYGYLLFITLEPAIEAHDIFIRFAKVFEQTYTRFLDLQKAEAQNKIIQAENERKTKELEDARQLQLAMLPRELPKLPNIEIAVYMKTATEVGGDYYDYHVHPDGTLTVILGDATGHGMMSGMMVSVMKSFFIADRSEIELKRFFENSNASIKDMQLGRLMMALIGVQITPEKIIAANAGMPSLFYFRNKSQKAGEFILNNMPLGAMKGTKYSLKQIRHEKGDTLLLMSDGFAELKNENNEIYGYQRALEEFKKVVKQKPEEIIDHLKDEGKRWTNDKELEDDVTFVVIKVK
ncbi:MAG: SpoIIE family protein phosphatase, partial [Ignavibacteria bacterium]|nr:SpoIIE family protein phosphatase [Ignavibacteria bacterium]